MANMKITKQIQSLGISVSRYFIDIITNEKTLPLEKNLPQLPIAFLDTSYIHEVDIHDQI